MIKQKRKRKLKQRFEDKDQKKGIQKKERIEKERSEKGRIENDTKEKQSEVKEELTEGPGGLTKEVELKEVPQEDIKDLINKNNNAMNAR